MLVGLIGLLLTLSALVAIVLSIAVIHARRTKNQANLEIGVQSVIRQVEHYEQRLSLIETHALNYATSLSADGIRALYMVHETLTLVQKLAEKVQLLIALGDEKALAQARLLLDPEKPCFGIPFEAIEVADPEEIKLLCGWTELIEDYLKTIGRDVSVASAKSKELHPKRRQRSATSEHLYRAGVLPPIPQDRSPVQ